MVVLYHASSHVKAAGVEPGFLFMAAEAVGFAGVRANAHDSANLLVVEGEG